MEEEEIVLPIDGILDLHTFRPDEAGSAVDEYLRVCHENGIMEVKIIHGKGKGMLRRTVHSCRWSLGLGSDDRAFKESSIAA